MTVLRLRTCPFCSSVHVSYDRWVVCQSAHAVLTASGAVHRKLTPAVTTTLIVLLTRRGRVSSPAAIAEQLWGSDWPEFYHSVIRTHIHTLRARGVVRVKGRHGWGYEVVDG